MVSLWFLPGTKSFSEVEIFTLHRWILLFWLGCRVSPSGDLRSAWAAEPGEKSFHVDLRGSMIDFFTASMAAGMSSSEMGISSAALALREELLELSLALNWIIYLSLLHVIFSDFWNWRTEMINYNQSQFFFIKWITSTPVNALTFAIAAATVALFAVIWDYWSHNSQRSN